jgi:hypothetical protein
MRGLHPRDNLLDEGMSPPETLALRVLQQQRRDTSEALRVLRQAFETPIDGSMRAEDLSWCEQQGRRDRSWLKETLNVAGFLASSLCLSAHEHLEAIERLRTGAMAPHADLTLVRSVMESALGIIWLCAPDAGVESRLCRSAAMFFESNAGQLSLLEATPGQEDDLRRVTEVVAEYEIKLQTHGFTVKRNKKGYVQTVAYGQQSAPIRRNITGLAQEVFGDYAFIYGLASGATHSRIWLTQGLEGTRLDLDRAAITPLLDFSDAVVDTLGAYLSITVDHWLRATHTRRIALLPRDPRIPSVDFATYRDRRRSGGSVAKSATPLGLGASFGGMFLGSALHKYQWRAGPEVPNRDVPLNRCD